MLAEAEANPASFEVEDAYAANELYQRNGWTDGLPIVPPTPELVAAFLERAGLRAEEAVRQCTALLQSPERAPSTP
jgi:hypothetical protein